ncbi:hypothetical protein SCG7109_AB_00470 [Chlamydiales bacterium SCGC AG-110-M15]|nr:hypothetical protein SCG7109_AB_00470 [Chlamydiales bacterium SCGC AG-110-M15]
MKLRSKIQINFLKIENEEDAASSFSNSNVKSLYDLKEEALYDLIVKACIPLGSPKQVNVNAATRENLMGAYRRGIKDKVGQKLNKSRDVPESLNVVQKSEGEISWQEVVKAIDKAELGTLEGLLTEEEIKEVKENTAKVKAKTLVEAEAEALKLMNTNLRPSSIDDKVLESLFEKYPVAGK